MVSPAYNTTSALQTIFWLLDLDPREVFDEANIIVADIIDAIIVDIARRVDISRTGVDIIGDTVIVRIRVEDIGDAIAVGVHRHLPITDLILIQDTIPIIVRAERVEASANIFIIWDTVTILIAHQDNNGENSHRSIYAIESLDGDLVLSDLLESGSPCERSSKERRAIGQCIGYRCYCRLTIDLLDLDSKRKVFAPHHFTRCREPWKRGASGSPTTSTVTVAGKEGRLAMAR